MYGTNGWVELQVFNKYDEYSMWEMRWIHGHNKGKDGAEKAKTQNRELKKA